MDRCFHKRCSIITTPGSIAKHGSNRDEKELICSSYNWKSVNRLCKPGRLQVSIRQPASSGGSLETSSSLSFSGLHYDGLRKWFQRGVLCRRDRRIELPARSPAASVFPRKIPVDGWTEPSQQMVPRLSSGNDRGGSRWT